MIWGASWVNILRRGATMDSSQTRECLVGFRKRVVLSQRERVGPRKMTVLALRGGVGVRGWRYGATITHTISRGILSCDGPGESGAVDLP